MLGYSVFRLFALLGRVFHQIRPNAIVAIVRVVVVQTAVRVDIARIVRVAGVRGSKPPIPIRRRVQAGICIFRIADGFGGRVALAARGAGKSRKGRGGGRAGRRAGG